MLLPAAIITMDDGLFFLKAMYYRYLFSFWCYFSHFSFLLLFFQFLLYTNTGQAGSVIHQVLATTLQNVRLCNWATFV